MGRGNTGAVRRVDTSFILSNNPALTVVSYIGYLLENAIGKDVLFWIVLLK